MSNNSLKSHRELRTNFWHYFLGTLSNNSIELTWILVMTLYALVDNDYSNKSIALFGFTDALWVVYSCTYYVARTTMVYNIAGYMVGREEHEVSVWIKSALYLAYMLLLPIAVPSLLWAGELLSFLGVSKDLLSFYVPYFRLSLLTILICPTAVIIPSYYMARFNAKVGSSLNMLTAISMPILATIALWCLKWGVNGMMVGCFLSNSIPLLYFICNAPDRFFKKGFEFDITKIKHLWVDAKWELVRKLSPRFAQVYVSSVLISLSPSLLSAKYLIYTVGGFLEGYVDSTAVVCNANVSHTIGCGVSRDDSYQANRYIWRLGITSLILTILVVVIVLPHISFILTLDTVVRDWFGKVVVWVLLLVEVGSRLRYYTILSVPRVVYKEYNGVSQLCYAIPTALMTPVCVYLFLSVFHFNLYGVFLTGALVGVTQWVSCEFYLRSKGIKIGF